MTHLQLVARQERRRAAWFMGERAHPQGLSGEERDVISPMFDQGYWLPVTPAQLNEGVDY